MSQHTFCSANITGNNSTPIENDSLEAISILNIEITTHYQTVQSYNIDANHQTLLADNCAPPTKLCCEIPYETLIMPEFLESYLLDEVFYYLDLDRSVINYFEQRIVSAFFDLVEKSGERADLTVNADLVIRHVCVVPAEEVMSCATNSEDESTCLPFGG